MKLYKVTVLYDGVVIDLFVDVIDNEFQLEDNAKSKISVEIEPMEG